MLRVSPQQRPRLTEIISNLHERIAEARMNGWLGKSRAWRSAWEPLNANSPASTGASSETAAADPPTSECQPSAIPDDLGEAGPLLRRNAEHRAAQVPLTELTDARIGYRSRFN